MWASSSKQFLKSHWALVCNSLWLLRAQLSFSDVVAMSLSCDERRWRQQRFLEYRALLAATQWLVSTISCFFFIVGLDKLFAKFASCHSRQFCWNFCKLSFWPTSKHLKGRLEPALETWRFLIMKVGWGLTLVTWRFLIMEVSWGPALVTWRFLIMEVHGFSR